MNLQRRVQALEVAQRAANRAAWENISSALDDYERLHPMPVVEPNEEDSARLTAWLKSRPEFDWQDLDDTPEDDEGDSYSTSPGTPEEWVKIAQRAERDAVSLEELLNACPLPDAARELVRKLRWWAGWSEAGAQALARMDVKR